MGAEKITPYYLILCEKFEKNCLEVEKSFKEMWGDKFLCGYSIKTNRYPALIMLAKSRGWLAEVVSNDEYRYANALGFGEGKMICNGPVKGEMLLSALRQSQYLNLDNLHEVERICYLVEHEAINRTDLHIGIRINFNLEEQCPGETMAEDMVSRFGISYENGDVERAINILGEHHIAVAGIHMHTSTKSRSLKVFHALSVMACRIIEEYKLTLDYVDIGGGFFGGQILNGKPCMKEYAKIISEELRKKLDPRKVTLIVEPGASVIATAVDYVAQVQNIRDVRGERVITLDGTSLHINPFMTKRKPVYEIDNIGENKIGVQRICGCTCMEKDYFDVLYNEQELLPDNKLCFHNVGAYTMCLNNHFIVEPPKVYLVRN